MDHAATVTAEMLMRSRYSAFVLKLDDYLLQTWHPSTRPAQLSLNDDSTEWIKLEILKHQHGAPGDSRGKVEFKAHYRLGANCSCLHEISRFCREDGKWLYLDGKIKSAQR